MATTLVDGATVKGVAERYDIVQNHLSDWRYGYNNIKPHSSLSNQTSFEARRALKQFEGFANDALA